MCTILILRVCAVRYQYINQQKEVPFSFSTFALHLGEYLLIPEQVCIIVDSCLMFDFIIKAPWACGKLSENTKIILHKTKELALCSSIIDTYG